MRKIGKFKGVSENGRGAVHSLAKSSPANASSMYVMIIMMVKMEMTMMRFI